MLWQRVSQRPWTFISSYSGEISPVPNDLTHCQAISWIFQSASAGEVSPAGQWPRAGISLAALCTAGVSLLHLPPSVLSQRSAPAPGGQPYRGKRGSEPLRKLCSPLPASFISFCKWFYCSYSFHGMTTKWRSDNDWLNFWGQFWFPVSAVERWPMLFHVGELPHFPIISNYGCQTPSSGHVNETGSRTRMSQQMFPWSSSLWGLIPQHITDKMLLLVAHGTYQVRCRQPPADPGCSGVHRVW